MKTHSASLTQKFKSLAAVLLVLAAGFVAGSASRQPVSADVRARTKPREAFKSGSERSEVVLREISATLKKMDARLERIETVATAQQQK